MKILRITAGVACTVFEISVQAWAQLPCDARIVDGKLYIPCLYLPDGSMIELKLNINQNLIDCISETGACAAPRSPVPKSWQTYSYAAGDDGDLERGAPWPTPRFTDNGDGSVTDNLTGLIWLKNANCFGTRSWTTALNDCDTLADGECGLTDGSSAGDWRLPNSKELYSIINIGFYDPALSNTEGAGQWEEGDPFIRVKSDYYWTSSTHASMENLAFIAHMISAGVVNGYKTNSYYVWPVRGGQ